MRNKTAILLLSAFLIGSGALAQDAKRWSLKDCIDYAKENNLGIKQQDINAEYKGNLYKQKKFERIPSLNGNVGYEIGFGRVLVDYDYVDKTTQSGNLSISSSVPIFNGFSLQNSIKQNKSDWMAARNELEAAKNDLALNITSYYLQVLFDKELLSVAQEQYNVAKEQVENTKKLVDAGRVAEGNLLEIKSQAAREALTATQMSNNLSLSLLNLAQALDLENTDSFDIVVPELPDLQKEELTVPSALFNTAVEIMPQIEASQYDLESARYAYLAAKGRLYPSLSLSTGWRTNVYKIEGSKDFDFGQQFRDKASEYVGLTLRIPIIDRLSARSNVKNTKLSILDAQNELEKKKQALRKEIQKAYTDAKASFQKFTSAQTAVESYEESLRYTEKKYAVGLVSPVDYSVARTDYLKAQSDFLQAKYEYVLRTKILDFYTGVPLSLQ
jgi:outer membrane protein